ARQVSHFRRRSGDGEIPGLPRPVRPAPHRPATPRTAASAPAAQFGPPPKPCRPPGHLPIAKYLASSPSPRHRRWIGKPSSAPPPVQPFRRFLAVFPVPANLESRAAGSRLQPLRHFLAIFPVPPN